jgi:hypothetical protein
MLGDTEGLIDGDAVGLRLGDKDGEADGDKLGEAEGLTDGLGVGSYPSNIILSPFSWSKKSPFSCSK